MGSNQYDIKIKVSTDGTTEVVSLGKNFKATGTEIETAAAKIAQIDAFAKLKKEVETSEGAWKQATITVGTLAKEIAASETPTKKQINAFERAKKSAAALKTAYEKNRLSLDSMRKGLTKAGVNTTKLASEQKKLKVEVDRSRKAIEQAAKVDAARGMLNVRPYKEVRAEITRLRGAYQTLKKSGTATVQELYQAELKLRQKTSELKQETSGWAHSITQAKGGLAALAATGYAFIQSMGNYSVFSQRMAEVHTLIDATDEELQQLGGSIRAVTRDIPQFAHELAAAEYDILSAGVALEKSTVVLEKSAKAAVGGMTDTKTAANVGIGVVNAYGLEIDKLDEVYDVLFTTVKKGVTTFPELSQNIGDVLPLARSADVDFRKVAASIAVMTKAGIKTPKASTALVGAITAMSAPAPEAKKKFEELGITWQGLIPTLEQIAKKSLTVDQMRELIPDKEARVGVLALTQNLDSLKGTLGEMNDVSGATDEAFDKMKNTPANQLKLFKNEVDTLTSAMGELLVSAGLPVLRFFREASGTIRESDIVTKALVVTLLGAGVGFTLWKLGLSSIVFGLRGMIGQVKLAAFNMDMLAASSVRASIAMRATLVGAIIYTGVKVLQLANNLWELKKAKEAALESTKQHAELESRLAKRLAETSEALGIQITSMEEFNRLEKEGIIYFDQAEGAWKKREAAALAAKQAELDFAKERLANHEAFKRTLSEETESAVLEVEKQAAAGIMTEEKAAVEIIRLHLAKHQILLDAAKRYAADVILIKGAESDEAKRAASAEKAAAEKLASYKIEAQKKVTASLKTELQARLSEEKRLISEIQALQEKAAGMRISKEDELRDIRRRSMTEAEKQADMELQASEKLAAAKDALRKGDTKRAEELARQAKSISSGLDSEKKALEGVKSAWEVMERSVTREEETKRAQLKKTQESIKTLKDDIQNVEKVMARLGESYLEVNRTIAQNPIRPKVDTNGLDDALTKHGRLDGLHTHSTHTTHFKGEGSATRPISEKIKEIQGWMQELDGGSSTHVTHFRGTGSTEAPLGDKVKDLTDQVQGFKSEFDETMQLKVDTSPAEEAMRSLADSYRADLVAIEKALIDLRRAEQKTSGTEFWWYVNQNKQDLFKQKKELERRMASMGFNSGGSVPGTGTGDVIPAMLTPKEYVQPVPAVNKYGVGFMEAIRRRQLPVDAVRALMSGRGYNVGGLVARRPLTVDVPRLHFNAGGQVPSTAPEQITERIEVTLVVEGKRYPGIFEKSAGREFISELGKAKNISIG